MPFRFHIPLPGPFSYSKTLGGKRRPSQPLLTPEQLERWRATNERGSQVIREDMARREQRNVERLGVDEVARRRRINTVLLPVVLVLLLVLVIMLVAL